MISAALGISERQISQTLGLLEDGATIPFISRYRKEATGGLDEVQIEAIQTQYEKLSETAKRKETILNTIQEHAVRPLIFAATCSDHSGFIAPKICGVKQIPVGPAFQFRSICAYISGPVRCINSVQNVSRYHLTIMPETKNASVA